MKKFLTSFFALAVAVSVWAVPARPGFKTYTQPDGSTVTVQKVGDEWHHATVTRDGYAVSRDDNGNMCYRTSAGVSNVLAHDAANRTSEELAFLQANSEAAKFKATPRARAKAAKANAARRTSQVPDQGSPHVPIILVQYKDVKFSITNETQLLAYFENQFSQGSESCHQYFYDQSGGMYDAQFDILGPVLLNDNRSTYGGNDENGDDKGVCKMVIEACKGLPTSVDWTRYDNDGDGEVDVVVVLYAGVGAADDDNTNAIWPCQWQLSDGVTYGDGTGSFTLDGVKIDKFGVFNEVGGSYSSHEGEIDGIGTFCHEFSHCLGLPDWYATDYSNHFGMGQWSILDGGCYCNDGFTPCGYTSYEKAFHGWRDLEEAVPGTHYSLLATNIEGGVGIKVQSDYNANEYYVLENRQLTGWDAYLPNNGLQVTHVYYSASAWDGNTVNNTSTRRMTIIPADNSLKMDYSQGSYFANLEDQENDLFPYQKSSSVLINELTDTSTPAATLYVGGKMGKPITNITKDATGLVTFDFMKGQMAPPELSDATDITDTSFKAEWSEVEGAQSYTLRVTPKGDEAELLLEENFSSFTTNTNDQSDNLDASFANEGWTGTAIYFENGGVRLSSSRKAGSLTSPTLAVSEGKVTVAYGAYSYGTDGNITMKVATGSDNKNVTVAKDVADGLVVLNAGEEDAVTFSASARQRPILTYIRIYDGDATEQLSANAPRRAEGNETLLFEGITETSCVVTGLTPETTYKFDVKAVGEDNESKWSAFKLVTTLEASQGIQGDVNGDGVVSGADVTALYNILLNDDPTGAPTVTGNPDVNGDGVVSGSDVTALYNILLQ
ncbi:MAG: M6 family metalloprotease domain-containing protein [Muribaculaceae bacterium]|nr:M6 family metalloprotease domain-containing protein [Muribaculaceae bacterium]